MGRKSKGQNQNQKRYAKPKKKSSVRPGRRRKVMMNFALVMVGIMALSMVLASYTYKAAARAPKAPSTKASPIQPVGPDPGQ